MPDEQDVFRSLWAKTAANGSYHPLLCHMVDTAKVAALLWQRMLPAVARQHLSRSLGLSEEHSARWIAFLAALHDMGKASASFALRDPDRASALAGVLPFPFHPSPCPHGTVTARVLPEILAAFGVRAQPAAKLATLLGGHHGIFPSNEDIQGVPASALGGPRWHEARSLLVRLLASALGLPDSSPLAPDNASALVLAGFVTVADWIASAEEYFPYLFGTCDSRPLCLDEYLIVAAERALSALARLGWRPINPASPMAFRQMFPQLNEPPRPLQLQAIVLAEQLREPTLILIEAPMGEGKTEAAIYLADRATLRLGNNGIYFALPTQASTNQMFSRVRDFLASRWSNEAINLQLVHGHASLSAEFEDLKRNADLLFTPLGVATDDGSQGGIAAAEWFTYRKRPLLAPFGVGTIDQSLLAALQTRHVFVRLFGLAGKTIVIDEVHAYDTYMTSLLERLLQWSASIRSTVVLLSATLPSARRESLAAAYLAGLGVAPPSLPATSYPRLTWVSATSNGASSFAASASSTREVAIDWLDGQLPDEGSESTLADKLRSRLSNGGCAVVVCNTVGRAQAAYRALKPHFPGQADDGGPLLDLLHARFTFHDRDTREKRALLRFGKPGGVVLAASGKPSAVRRPSRAILVATQIVEQSLDLDFDLMVTDFAPVDLLLQRSGRLWRHERSRPEGLSGPDLSVCMPALEGEVPQFEPGFEQIYDPHVLLKTWLAMRDRNSIRIPEDVEPLIGAVYDESAPPAFLPAPLRDRWVSTAQKLAVAVADEKREAADRWLRPPDYDGPLGHYTSDPREEDSPDFHRAHQALTRLADPSVSVVILDGTYERPTLGGNGEVVDLTTPPSISTAKSLLARSVTLTDRRVVYDLLSQSPPPAWRRSALLCRHRLVVLDSSNRFPVGRYFIELRDEEGIVVNNS